MESKSNFVLRHKETGSYYGYDLERTKNLFKAWRFFDEQQLNVWLDNSIYTPEFRDEYEAVPVELTIAVKE